MMRLAVPFKKLYCNHHRKEGGFILQRKKDKQWNYKL
nr:MAG TPA: hypothetical protein [Caudoviricetes sp.]